VVKILDKNKILYEDSREQEPCCERNYELKKITCFIHVPNKVKWNMNKTEPTCGTLTAQQTSLNFKQLQNALYLVR